MRFRTGLAVLAVLLVPTLVAEGPASESEPRAAPHARVRLFMSAADEGVGDVLRDGHRWKILFAPGIDSCTPQEIQLLRALGKLLEEDSTLGVATILPKGLPRRVIERGVFGDPFPGRIVTIEPQHWLTEGQVAPRPRVEVWSGEGQLLLMRSLPSTATSESLYEELLWARSFTEPASSSSSAAR